VRPICPMSITACPAERRAPERGPSFSESTRSCRQRIRIAGITAASPSASASPTVNRNTRPNEIAWSDAFSGSSSVPKARVPAMSITVAAPAATTESPNASKASTRMSLRRDAPRALRRARSRRRWMVRTSMRPAALMPAMRSTATATPLSHLEMPDRWASARAHAAKGRI
jgi:hypothetical protein